MIIDLGTLRLSELSVYSLLALRDVTSSCEMTADGDSSTPVLQFLLVPSDFGLADIRRIRARSSFSCAFTFSERNSGFQLGEIEKFLEVLQAGVGTFQRVAEKQVRHIGYAELHRVVQHQTIQTGTAVNLRQSAFHFHLCPLVVWQWSRSDDRVRGQVGKLSEGSLGGVEAFE